MLSHTWQYIFLKVRKTVNTFCHSLTQTLFYKLTEVVRNSRCFYVPLKIQKYFYYSNLYYYPVIVVLLSHLNGPIHCWSFKSISVSLCLPNHSEGNYIKSFSAAVIFHCKAVKIKAWINRGFSSSDLWWMFTRKPPVRPRQRSSDVLCRRWIAFSEQVERLTTRIHQVLDFREQQVWRRMRNIPTDEEDERSLELQVESTQKRKICTRRENMCGYSF